MQTNHPATTVQAGSPQRETTGLAGLDEILDGLRMGDNVVWKVDKISDYRYFVKPFVERAIQNGKKVIYLRFARHEPLLEPNENLIVHELDAGLGFESFAARIHSRITREGRGAFYVFDCLSDLLSAWAVDLMIGDFFKVTCPYLYDLDTVAYFALLRGSHSLNTISRIRETTQLLISVHNHNNEIHIHPLKVWQRYSPTMFLPHVQREARFSPLANSYDATNLLSNVSRKRRESSGSRLDYWQRLFMQAENVAGSNESPREQKRMVDHLCRHLIGREERMLALAREHFTLDELLNVKSRMIGTGYIGGKAAGMLLARNILLGDKSFDWKCYLEMHDSFHVGSHVYYSYIVHNGWWKLLMKQKEPEGYYAVAAELREKMLHGTFPDEIREGFQQMMEYYGQYPIIVRSSSLLEDGFGNAFAGKYDSFFLANQGTPEERQARLEDAVRKIFASTLSEDALAYRKQRGLDRLEEQMSLLIQRVSGAYRKHYYFPELAGVGVSFNTFVWRKEMDPRAGMLRLVLGLGTRAVDRVEHDYPRIIALDAPLKKPQAGFSDTRRFSQHEVDLINVNANEPQTVSLQVLSNEGLDISMERYGVKDYDTISKLKANGEKDPSAWILTFDRLLSETNFADLMKKMLKTLEETYDYPVNIEFTVNFTPDDMAQINLVQCRPLQTKGEQRKKVEMPRDAGLEQTFFRLERHFMGGSIAQPIRRLIAVDPEQYSALDIERKHAVARLIGRLNKSIGDRYELPTLLVGPGRWGTSMPSLGVPVKFAEINNILALAEVAFVSGEFMPELSYGTHFFQDLVETDIFYLAVFPDHDDCFYNRPWLEALPNILADLVPDCAEFHDVVKVADFPERGLLLMADVVSQDVICFQARERSGTGDVSGGEGA